VNINLAGRNALITGGSLGIGLAIAKRFAKSGGNVAIVARRPEVLDQALSKITAEAETKVIAIAADVSTADGCAHAFKTAEDGLGQIDILVNNAGTSTKGPFESISDDVWQDDLDLKLFATIRLCRLALPGMKQRRWGRVINVLNIGAKAPPAEGAPTAISRAAGMALTKALANEYAPSGVLVNSLHVGRIRSDQWVQRHAKQGEGQGGGQSLEDFYAEMGKSIPIGRPGEAEEFANMACMLASDEGGYVTGAAINVDGGLSPVV